MLLCTFLSLFPQLAAGLSSADPSVEALVTREPALGSVPITLVVGLPGADQANVVGAVVQLLGDEAAPRAALVTGGKGCDQCI